MRVNAGCWSDKENGDMTVTACSKRRLEAGVWDPSDKRTKLAGELGPLAECPQVAAPGAAACANTCLSSARHYCMDKPPLQQLSYKQERKRLRLPTNPLPASERHEAEAGATAAAQEVPLKKAKLPTVGEELLPPKAFISMATGEGLERQELVASVTTISHSLRGALGADGAGSARSAPAYQPRDVHAVAAASSHRWQQLPGAPALAPSKEGAGEQGPCPMDEDWQGMFDQLQLGAQAAAGTCGGDAEPATPSGRETGSSSGDCAPQAQTRACTPPRGTFLLREFIRVKTMREQGHSSERAG